MAEGFSSYEHRLIESFQHTLRTLTAELKRYNDARGDEPQEWSHLATLLDHHANLDRLRALLDSATMVRAGLAHDFAASSGHPVLEMVDRVETEVLRELVITLEKLDGGRHSDGFLSQNA